MKKILSVAALLFCIASALQSQSLQFNQVLKVSIAEDTVPAGAVWKVESYWQSNTVEETGIEIGACGLAARHHPFYIDDDYYFRFEGSPGTGSTSRWKSVGNSFPLWLPAGSRVRTLCSGDFLSVIEFNVVP